jgi:hypothetical protein
VVGGALLMNSFRGMFGGNQGQGQSAINSGGGSGVPWGSGAGGGDLARQAGIDDIAGGGKTAALGDAGSSQPTGLFGGAQNDAGEPDFGNDLSDDFEIDGDT